MTWAMKIEPCSEFVSKSVHGGAVNRLGLFSSTVASRLSALTQALDESSSSYTPASEIRIAIDLLFGVNELVQLNNPETTPLTARKTIYLQF